MKNFKKKTIFNGFKIDEFTFVDILCFVFVNHNVKFHVF